jgi:hypothetical protein
MVVVYARKHYHEAYQKDLIEKEQMMYDFTLEYLGISSRKDCMRGLMKSKNFRLYLPMIDYLPFDNSVAINALLTVLSRVG